MTNSILAHESWATHSCSTILIQARSVILVLILISTREHRTLIFNTSLQLIFWRESIKYYQTFSTFHYIAAHHWVLFILKMSKYSRFKRLRMNEWRNYSDLHINFETLVKELSDLTELTAIFADSLPMDTLTRILNLDYHKNLEKFTFSHKSFAKSDEETLRNTTMKKETDVVGKAFNSYD